MLLGLSCPLLLPNSLLRLRGSVADAPASTRAALAIVSPSLTHLPPVPVPRADGSSCNALGVARTINALEWSGAAAFAAAPRCVWKVRGSPAGVAHSAGQLTWLVLLNSGHLVPMNQPEHAYEMVRRFIGGSLGSLCEG
jgi:carboxypeptidase C (cathepsin A)